MSKKCLLIIFSSSIKITHLLDGFDYVEMTQTLTFDRDTTSFTIPVTLINDNVHEMNEEFFGLLTTVEDFYVVIFDPFFTIIQIMDEDG